MLIELKHVMRIAPRMIGSQMQVKLNIEIEADLNEIGPGLLAALLKQEGQKSKEPVQLKKEPVDEKTKVSAWKDMPSLPLPTSRGKVAYGFMRDGSSVVENPQEQRYLKAMWDLKMNLGLTRWSDIARKLNQDGARRRNGTEWCTISVRNLFLGTFK